VRARHSPIAEPLAGASPARWSANLPIALLFALAIAARALLLTALPLQALAVAGDAAGVSRIYFIGSVASLASSLLLPALLARVARPAVFLLGCLLAVAGPLLAAIPTSTALILGLAAQMASVAIIEIVLNLFVLDRVPRRRLSTFESLRLFVSGLAWMTGPYLGVWLQENLGHDVPFHASSAMGLLLVLAFLALRPQAVRQAAMASPLVAIGRYWRQPRLRLAWVLAFGRSCWWVMFFVYGPIFLVDQLGYSRDTAGAIASAVLGITFLVPLWGWIGRRITFRRLLILGYGLSALSTIPLALVGEPPWLAAGLLIFASILTSLIDGAGNTPFLRAVKPLQKAEMTAVFMTYRDGSQLATPGVFSQLLKFLPLSSVFVATAIGMAGLALLARYLPKRF
jgi:ACDE family multidrug resistance protein